ncbi:MAG: hypothetical protein JWM14_2098 [Chitinophagaceae bacterium]|nr:hypothetical protein [Chitinophagaceae bacterium]
MKSSLYIFYVTLLAALVISVISFAQAPDVRINISKKGLYPEGVAYDPATHLFYTGSVTDAVIGSVDHKGKYAVIYADSNLKSTYGMKVDSKRNLLWVCAGDANYSKHSTPATHKKMAKVIALDLTTHKIVKSIDLSKLYAGPHFANDLCLDDKGNIYITDSFSPVIYKIDTKDKASVFLQSDLFKGEDVGLNGIAFHKDGFLLIAMGSTGSIFKVTLKNAARIHKVTIDRFFSGADGLLVTKEKSLIVVQNKGTNAVFELTSTDQWLSAKVKNATSAEAYYQQPSTATFADDKIYVLNSKLDELANPAKKPSESFPIQEVLFHPVE